MSSEVIISVENLGKCYQISHQGDRQRYTALRDVLAQKFKAPFKFLTGGKKKTAPSSQPSREEFWALRDVSFEIKRGEVMGIIGRNGAGKSTLLKVLSRITEPTRGRVHLRGRVASLLEVGTGFHPELTGRENIFLNGAILGMSRVEIKRKFDEIVEFSEVEKFLDTPVKRYSSGMYVRLAFGVAAHLEPEILIVDEVLAVGDIEFQDKCLGKMQAVSKSGRTVLFVSHNLASITNLCDRCVLLKGGRVQVDTTAEKAVQTYLKLALDNATDEPHVLYTSNKQTDGYAITRVEMFDEHDQPKATVRPFDYVKFRLWFNVPAVSPQGSVLFEIGSPQVFQILKLETNPQQLRPLDQGTGLKFVDCVINSLPLLEGRYVIRAGLAIYATHLLHYLADAGTLLVTQPAPGRNQFMLRDVHGLLGVEHSWRCG